MLELICDQSYTWDGVPADKSPYHNDGTGINTGGSFDGMGPGSGMITFPQPDSRVRIGGGGPWQSLIALKIDILARLDPHARRVSVMVDGHGSFRFGVMEGALEAQFTNASGSNNYVRSADQFAPDHMYHPVPANKWVWLSLHHDGFAKMRLFIEGELVGEAIVDGGIPPVDALGVSIGNAADVDGYRFPGEIDELRIWRHDPKGMKREFLGRPYTRKTARCWQRLFEAVNAWMESNPEQSRALTDQLTAVRDTFVRSLLLLPDGDQAKLRAAILAINKLWFEGEIDGPAMEMAFCDWIALLGSFGIEPVDDPSFDALKAALAKVDVDGSALLKCDPKIALFLERLRHAAKTCGKQGRARA
jgi:Concanavalin A-like lectin/glucanases superfamily